MGQDAGGSWGCEVKLLYLSCHSVLEADELGLFNELGIYVFSPGSYVEAANPGDDSLRNKPVLKAEHVELYNRHMQMFHRCGKPGIDNKENLSEELLREFDAVMVMHIPAWLTKNWDVIKKTGITATWRTIGQSWAGNEAEIRPLRKDGLKIVRYNARESKIPGFIGGDVLIPFFKDPEAFGGWTGEKAEVLCVGQHLQKRGAPCNWNWLNEVSDGFPRKLYGPGSETTDWGHGKLSFEDMRAAMRQHRVAINGGTFPASVVMSFQEEMMTGIPVVAVGEKLGHPIPWFANHFLYAGTDIIENGVNGWCSDDMDATRDFIKQLLNDQALAKKIGDAGRATAIELWGKEKISAQWKSFFESL